MTWREVLIRFFLTDWPLFLLANMIMGYKINIFKHFDEKWGNNIIFSYNKYIIQHIFTFLGNLRFLKPVQPYVYKEYWKVTLWKHNLIYNKSLLFVGSSAGRVWEHQWSTVPWEGLRSYHGRDLQRRGENHGRRRRQYAIQYLMMTICIIRGTDVVVACQHN